MKVAIIGSGISGLSASYYLSKKHKVDLFEQEDHFGGHSYTYDSTTSTGTKVPVDWGFSVFNELTYPNLFNFWDNSFSLRIFLWPVSFLDIKIFFEKLIFKDL